MDEKLKILKLVEEGKISAAEATKLLENLSENNEKEKNIDLNKVKVEDDFFDFPVSKSKEKLICVRVLSSDGDKVKINLPLNMVKVLCQCGSAIPGLNSTDVDIDMKKIIEAIDSGFVGRIVDISDGDGDKVIVEIV
ncbi:MAG: SHOCT-like domain-containing protein [Sarcina sp.]